MKIEAANSVTFEKLLPLIAEYQRFYRVTPVTEANRAHFSQFLTDHTRGIQFIAIDPSGILAGFATLYFVPSSLKPGLSCLMNDLYTLPPLRGQGIGRFLIEHCLAYAKERGFDGIEWQTQLSNTDAQQLYNRLDAQKSAWYHYRYSVLE